MKDAIYNNTLHDFNCNLKFLCGLLLDVATGIRDIHDAGFVHNDIKPANVLLEDDSGKITALISDFGISKVVNEQVILVSGFSVSKMDGASVAYAAPEVLRRMLNQPHEDDFNVSSSASRSESSNNNTEIIKSCDVYSYAMVMYEVLTKSPPWPSEMPMEEIIKLVLREKRPTLPSELEETKNEDKLFGGLWDLMHQCWHNSPKKRLQIRWVVEIIDSMKAS